MDRKTEQEVKQISDRVIEDARLLREEQYDDEALSIFMSAMRAKLTRKRREGRGGWYTPKQCTIESLEKMLHEHIDKGDMVDIANFCMMIFVRRLWEEK
jgi:deoxyribodipyrimidine photolyase-like uncharacterized protein